MEIIVNKPKITDECSKCPQLGRMTLRLFREAPNNTRDVCSEYKLDPRLHQLNIKQIDYTCNMAEPFGAARDITAIITIELIDTETSCRIPNPDNPEGFYKRICNWGIVRCLPSTK